MAYPEPMKKSEQLVNRDISEAEETEEEVEAEETQAKPEAEIKKVQPAEDIERGWTPEEKDEEGGIAETGT